MAIKTDILLGSGSTETSTLDDVTSRGATTTNSITVGGLSVGTAYSLPTIDGSSGQAIVSDGAGNLSFTTIDPTGGLEYKGTFNATAGTPSLANAEQGDYYKIDTAGTIYGQTWAVGDSLLINADMGGTITNSKIDKIDNTDTPASETVAGVIEIATNAEATAGTATDKALVPSNLSSVDLSVLDNTTSAFITAGDIPTASETVAGKIEIATNAEATAGTATDKALVPSNISSLDLSAMNNTTSAFISDITGESLNDLSDVSYTAGAGIDNYVLTYDHSTTSWGAESAPGSTPASETVAGIIEIATNAEATAGTATDKALVPSNLSSVDLSVLDNTTSAFITAGDIPTASETVAGKIEIATNAEATAGTATDKALVPSNISSLDLSAMDNTTSAFISDITSESLNDLSDVSFTAGAGIDNYVLTYDHSTTSWGAEASSASNTPLTSASPSSDYTISSTSGSERAYILTPSADINVNLPSASSAGSGFKYIIKNMSSAYTLTVDANSTETIDGTQTYDINVQYQSLTIISDGTNWLII